MEQVKYEIRHYVMRKSALFFGRIIMISKKDRDRRSRSHQEWLMEYLQDDEAALSYLNVCLEEKDDPEAFLMALRNVAEAHGMSNVAAAAGLNRESFYRMLSANGNPRLTSLHAVLDALGLTLRVDHKAT